MFALLLCFSREIRNTGIKSKLTLLTPLVPIKMEEFAMKNFDQSPSKDWSNLIPSKVHKTFLFDSLNYF